MIKAPSWSLHDLNFVLTCFKKSGSEKMTQKQINTALIDERKRIGTWKGEKNLSWQISRLSKTSKHRKHDEEKIRTPHAYINVVKFIKKCVRCTEQKAEDIYLSKIIESGISDYNFYDPNQRNLAAIRFDHPKRCKDMLYIAFTSEDYDDLDEDGPAITYEMNEETGELIEILTPPEPKDEKQPSGNIWTCKSPYIYQQVLTGQVTRRVLEAYLHQVANIKHKDKRATKDYTPVYVNCCVQTNVL